MGRRLELQHNSTRSAPDLWAIDYGGLNRRRFLVTLAYLSGSALGMMSTAILISDRANCQTDEETEYFETANPIFYKSQSIRVFAFPEPIYAGGVDLTVETLGQIPKANEINESSRRFIMSKLTEASSYQFGLRKATRFYANRALIFEGTNVKNVFLISTDFRGGRLVLERPLNPRVFIVNLDPIFSELSEVLTRSLQ